MPFQFAALAFKSNTGTPLTKLAWIWIMLEVKTEDAPNAKGYVEGHLAEMMAFCQCDKEEALSALRALARMQKIFITKMPDDGWDMFFDVDLPISTLPIEYRKRIKATPDQTDKLVIEANYRCPMCGRQSYDDSGWHVDHIIPRSKGGADVEENCQTICGPCNGKKAAKTGWVDFLA